MNDKKNTHGSLREMYKLEYDTSGRKSGLITWYNRLIDKKIDELNATDVSKMIRQGILKNVAIDKAIELFMENPYDGDMGDGGLLSLLISLDEQELKEGHMVGNLLNYIICLQSARPEFEWIDKEQEELFNNDLAALINGLSGYTEKIE